VCDAAGRHLRDLHAGRAIALEQAPGYHVLLANGAGAFLREPGT
jgi:hypothetical protein